MSWVRIWVHLVFSTQYRRNLLISKEVRKKLYDHIKSNAENKQIWVEAVGGYSNHLHCLISLGREQTISKVAMLIKGESSHWLNENQLTHKKFRWQDDYWAVSICDEDVYRVKNYILNQEEHHGEKSFSDEVGEFEN